MIQILDEIRLAPNHVPTVLALLDERYMPHAAARGLTLLQRWVSPPVAVPGEQNRLWLLWQVPDVWGYYGMRLRAGAEVLEFWTAVDELCQHRSRHVLGSADQPLPSLEVAENVA
ncbi:hypothetical protein NVV94_15725 [Pseudomonas sp. LS1212]|uniref:hypothetical protein n=1 Tax=Pseudomonas sp. LS1212 TaxID=2972478 RepID=UPI00215D2CA7|nr:hypothetical protein [Pseudomonas sp. LS1212]UVJ42110.1 hypothetical protein NVV94_15725 [Pseudomonas sp. LS1212]